MAHVTRTRQWPRKPIRAEIFLLCAGLAAPFTSPSVALAQSPVVQAVPPREAGNLNDALRRLASNPRNLDALIDAGNASLLLSDVDAAIGFFGRADELSPNNARVKLGLAAAFVQSGKPIEAFALFDQAQAVGGTSGMLAADRGLAFDLIGDASRAQEEYGRALAAGRTDEIIRRLAVSHAIAGNRRSFEDILRPLINARDFAAYRARAFGLAILGEADEAVAITEAVMPRDLSGRLAPYLRYMAKLTPAQQAAAANLGIFPRAGQMGRDDPQYAQFRENNGKRAVQTADARLAPRGLELGSVRRRPGPVTAEAGRGAQAKRERARRRASSDPLSRTRQSRVAVRTPEQAAIPVASAVPAPEPASALATPPAATTVQAAQTTLTSAGPVRVELPPSVPAGVATRSAPSDLAIAAPVAADPQTASAVLALQEPRPAISVARSDSPTISATTPPPTAATTPPSVWATRLASTPGSTPDQPLISSPAASVASTTAFDLADVPASSAAPAATEITSVAAAFEGFSLPAPGNANRASNAVDITAIEPPREVKAEPAAPATRPAPPADPSRIWVQIATGKDRSALRFDWRRLSRKAADVLTEGRGPFTAEWNTSTRLLAGPFANQAAARKAMTALTEAGIDSFIYTSPVGEKIVQLK